MRGPERSWLLSLGTHMHDTFKPLSPLEARALTGPATHPLLAVQIPVRTRVPECRAHGSCVRTIKWRLYCRLRQTKSRRANVQRDTSGTMECMLRDTVDRVLWLRTLNEKRIERL
jgi:hypothetical protein